MKNRTGFSLKGVSPHVLRTIFTKSLILSGFLLLLTTAYGGTLNSRIELQVFSPDFNAQISTSPVAIVGASAVEFPAVAQYDIAGSNLVNVSIDVQDSSVTISFENAGSGSFATALVNTYVLTDIDDTMPEFTGFSIDNSVTTLDIQSSAITFNAHQLFIDVSGLSFNTSTVAKFNITFSPHPGFFNNEDTLANGVYYLEFPSGNYFGFYSYLTDPNYLYHFDLGYEYVFDAMDGNAGVYFYDFKSNDFFYTSPSFPFPYLYDFDLQSTVYYYPDPNISGHYNTNGVRYFYVFNTGQIISK